MAVMIVTKYTNFELTMLMPPEVQYARAFNLNLIGPLD